VEKKVITSSEIERFAYCPYSWWLSREGVRGEGDAIKQGVEEHHDLEKSLDLIKEVDIAAGEAETGLIGFNSGTIILALLGIMVLTLGFLREEESSSLGAIIIIFGLVWTLIASFYLYQYLTRTDVSMTLRASHGVPAGQIEFSDKIRAPSYFSEQYMLSGKPDYVIKKGDDYIPVEVKTGRVPRGPFFSHIVQVVAYCMLVEDHFERAPPHGILEYSDHIQHPIEYDEKGKAMVMEKLDEMREMLNGEKKPYRNHNRKGKCINCSRRGSCPVRLA
jgi:CRISPR-associated exonuclease Cas4